MQTLISVQAALFRVRFVFFLSSVMSAKRSHEERNEEKKRVKYEDERRGEEEGKAEGEKSGEQQDGAEVERDNEVEGSTEESDVEIIPPTPQQMEEDVIIPETPEQDGDENAVPPVPEQPGEGEHLQLDAFVHPLVAQQGQALAVVLVLLALTIRIYF